MTLLSDRKRNDKDGALWKWLVGISGPVISILLALLFVMLMRTCHEHEEINLRLEMIEQSLDEPNLKGP